jgi:hypothetical protein
MYSPHRVAGALAIGTATEGSIERSENPLKRLTSDKEHWFA